MREVIGICDKHGCQSDSFERVLEELYSLLGHYSGVHTNNNWVLIVALLLGKRDFHKTITLSVMGGFDSDCNGATIGSIIGARCWAQKRFQRIDARLHDTLRSQIVGYDPIPISKCAQKRDIARKIAGVAG
jgi:ADP-ribosylglycohydrolase